jgi:hypothetical protein
VFLCETRGSFLPAMLIKILVFISALVHSSAGRGGRYAAPAWKGYDASFIDLLWKGESFVGKRRKGATVATPTLVDTQSGPKYMMTRLPRDEFNLRTDDSKLEKDQVLLLKTGHMCWGIPDAAAGVAAIAATQYTCLEKRQTGAVLLASGPALIAVLADVDLIPLEVDGVPVSAETYKEEARFAGPPVDRKQHNIASMNSRCGAQRRQ